MRRIVLNKARDNWKQKIEQQGFYFYEMYDQPYWDEKCYYEFTLEQIDYIEAVTNELYKMCLKVVEYVIKNNLFNMLFIPEGFVSMIKESWKRKQPSIYGRFDFWWDGISEPKLYEFNADTPTALFESSVIQYYWLQDISPEKDQFNSLHERLIEVFKKKIKPKLNNNTLYFSCVKDTMEDLTTIEYLRDCAIQSGINTKHIFVEDIGYSKEINKYLDLDYEEINYMFKLYPWEWLVREEFGSYIATSKINLYEPPWKMILSNKAMLPIIWEMFPNHKNLLPAYFKPIKTSKRYVEKPYFSREGEDIIVSSIFTQQKSERIYQEYIELPNYNGNYPVIGSWIIDDQAAGMGIREDNNPITNNLSRFVPHLFFD